MKRLILHHITCTKCNQVKPIVRSTNKLKLFLCDDCIDNRKKEYQRNLTKTRRSVAQAPSKG